MKTLFESILQKISVLFFYYQGETYSISQIYDVLQIDKKPSDIFLIKKIEESGIVGYDEKNDFKSNLIIDDKKILCVYVMNDRQFNIILSKDDIISMSDERYFYVGNAFGIYYILNDKEIEPRYTIKDKVYESKLNYLHHFTYHLYPMPIFISLIFDSIIIQDGKLPDYNISVDNKTYIYLGKYTYEWKKTITFERWKDKIDIGFMVVKSERFNYLKFLAEHVEYAKIMKDYFDIEEKLNFYHRKYSEFATENFKVKVLPKILSEMKSLCLKSDYLNSILTSKVEINNFIKFISEKLPAITKTLLKIERKELSGICKAPYTNSSISIKDGVEFENNFKDYFSGYVLDKLPDSIQSNYSNYIYGAYLPSFFKCPKLNDDIRKYFYINEDILLYHLIIDYLSDKVNGKIDNNIIFSFTSKIFDIFINNIDFNILSWINFYLIKNQKYQLNPSDKNYDKIRYKISHLKKSEYIPVTNDGRQLFEKVWNSILPNIGNINFLRDSTDYILDTDKDIFVPNCLFYGDTEQDVEEEIEIGNKENIIKAYENLKNKDTNYFKYNQNNDIFDKSEFFPDRAYISCIKEEYLNGYEFNKDLLFEQFKKYYQSASLSDCFQNVKINFEESESIYLTEHKGFWILTVLSPNDEFTKTSKDFYIGKIPKSHTYFKYFFHGNECGC